MENKVNRYTQGVMATTKSHVGWVFYTQGSWHKAGRQQFLSVQLSCDCIWMSAFSSTTFPERSTNGKSFLGEQKRMQGAGRSDFWIEPCNLTQILGDLTTGVRVRLGEKTTGPSWGGVRSALLL